MLKGESEAVDRWLEEHSRFELIWLPSYCPKANPIEPVFGDGHEKMHAQPYSEASANTGRGRGRTSG